MTRILVLGSGGREHALAWRLARDPGTEVVVAPGNDFIATRWRCVPTPDPSPDGLVALAERERAELVVVGPEQPLADGLADSLTRREVPVLGPTQGAARLESSKRFAKDVLRAAGVATAEAVSCASTEEVSRALDRFAAPHVVKLDGLAAGKGVLVTSSRSEAEAFAARSLARGPEPVLIEKFLEGEEASVMAVCDGARAVMLPPARDYKRAEDGDRGPNTGGMGAYAPAAIGEELEREIHATIVLPVLREMAARGAPFRGVLYCGLMLGVQGPRVVEFNVRFGDPEAQVILPLVTGSLTHLCASAAGGTLMPEAVGRATSATSAAVVVALVDRDYPGTASGGSLRGLEDLAGAPGTEVFGAAISRAAGGWRLTGGRGAYVMATGVDRAEARARAYAAVDRLEGEGWRCRRDIAAVGAPSEAERFGARAASSRAGRS